MSVFLLCLRNCVKHESTSLPLFFNYLIVSRAQIGPYEVGDKCNLALLGG